MYHVHWKNRLAKATLWQKTTLISNTVSYRSSREFHGPSRFKSRSMNTSQECNQEATEKRLVYFDFWALWKTNIANTIGYWNVFVYVWIRTYIKTWMEKCTSVGFPYAVIGRSKHEIIKIKAEIYQNKAWNIQSSTHFAFQKKLHLKRFAKFLPFYSHLNVC